MADQKHQGRFQHYKEKILGKPLNLKDKSTFHNLSLVAFFAWVGLGADGLSSSCYGPDEIFRTLQEHSFLSLFVALGTAATIFIISTSYSQIIELFPAGGGGYLVASRLLSPKFGMVSGCALMIDYVLTIAVSVSSGADAIFSFLPLEWHFLKIVLALGGVIMLMAINLRGIKESVMPLVPIFLVFLATHVFVIGFAVISHASGLSGVFSHSVSEAISTSRQIGVWPLLFLLLYAYSMGAGTYTGIEAVSNGLPILREPKVLTARKTMRLMTYSLIFMVLGLLLAYLLFKITPTEGKTMNAVLLETIAARWGESGHIFVLITLLSEAVLLFVAAQTGFLDGPRILASMAIDRWVPTSFTLLSDRLVTQNGIMLMGVASFITVAAAKGSVRLLVVLYSINVFITFVLSQLGMIRHWWAVRGQQPDWHRKLAINGFGFLLSAFILVSVIIIKFNEGGYITIGITCLLILLVSLIRQHYRKTAASLQNLERLTGDLIAESREHIPRAMQKKKLNQQHPECSSKTAVILVNGFSGLGLRTLYSVFELFEDTFKNFVFLQVGMVDAGNFKNESEMNAFEKKVDLGLNHYVALMKEYGYHSESFYRLATDIVRAIDDIAPKIIDKYPHCVFFGGKIVFRNESFVTRLLHNNTAFAIQRRLHHKGIPSVILPVQTDVTH